MGGDRFDAATRGLANAITRRTLFGGLLGGWLAAQASAPAFAARNRKRRGRNNDGDDAAAEDVVAPGTMAGGVWEESIEMCRFDFESGDYEIVAVSPTEVPVHLNAGDTLYLDCCVDTDCDVRPCLVATGCIEGACAYDNTEGTSCDPGDGTSGVCDDRGVCVSTGAVTTAPVG